LVVEIHAAALNPVDIQFFSFWKSTWGLLGSGEKGVGEDFSGVIIEKGSQASFDYQIGMPVFGFHMKPFGPHGTLATHLTLDPATSVVVPKPEGLSHQMAAALPLVFLTSFTALVEYGRLTRPGSENSAVAVLGASGGTGVFGLQIAKQYFRVGVLVGTCSQKNESFTRHLGADEVIDYTKESVLDGLRRYKPQTGYDVIYDCVGGTELIPYLSELLSKDGAYVTIVGDKTSRGSMGGSLTNWWSPRQILRTSLGKFGLGPRYYCINLTAKAEFLSPALELFNDGRLVVPIDSVFPFTEQGVRDAFERLDTGRAKGKVVIQVANE